MLINHKITPPKKQQGVVIILGLLLMLVLTVLGIASMGKASLSEKITSNSRETQVAFNAAESALKDGENWLADQTTIVKSDATCQSGCTVWPKDTLTSSNYKNDSWWNSSNATSFSSTLSGVSTQPAYTLEEHAFIPDELSPDAASKGIGYYYYKVTSKGIGANINSKVYLESIYVKKVN